MLNLVVLLIVPFIAALIVLLAAFMPRNVLKGIAIIASLVPLGLLLLGGSEWLNTQLNFPWIPSLGINFHLQVDQLTLLFLFLTAIIIPYGIYADWQNQHDLKHPHYYYATVLILQGLLIGFFTSRDLVFFTLFWEAMLLPLYFIIAFWGKEHRQETALKFLIYMIAGSTLMIAAVLALYFANGAQTFDLAALSKVTGNLPHADLIAAAFFLAFAVKTPLFPFHAWLPDTYYEAPVGGTILLSALLSKAGIYGFFRIAAEFFPMQLEAWSPLLLGLAIIGVFYGGFAAWGQTDFKRLLAYSSFSHVNFVLAGFFAWNHLGLSASLLQALNHGLTIAALFLTAGWLQRRVGTTSLNHLGGLAKPLTRLCWLTLFFVLAAVALPGLNNFVGEWLTFLALFTRSHWLAGILVLSVILSAIYMLRFMERIFFGIARAKDEYFKLSDITLGELAIALPLAGLVLAIGIYPTPLLEHIELATNQLIAATASVRPS